MPNRRRRRRTRRTNVSTPLPPIFRRRSTKWLVAAIITLGIGLLLGLIASVTGSGDGEETPGAPTAVSRTAGAPTPTLAVELPGIAPDPSLLEPATVSRVIDGDTIVVELGGREEHVRYYGIDTPERDDACFGEATDRNEALVGEVVLLLPDARERDSFGRLLRYIFTEDGDSIDARLIGEGLAHAWTEDGAYRIDLIALEDEARSEGVGCLWE